MRELVVIVVSGREELEAEKVGVEGVEKSREGDVEKGNEELAKEENFHFNQQ